MSSKRDVTIEKLNRYMPIRDFCRSSTWPKLSQVNHWIYSNHEISKTCIKKVGGRYIIDTLKFEKYVDDHHEFDVETESAHINENETKGVNNCVEVKINFSEELQKDVVLSFIKECIDQHTKEIKNYIDLMIIMKSAHNEHEDV